MRWSKLKKLTEERFCAPLASRLSLNSAAYGNCSCGHLWITLDKTIIANFCTRAYYNLKFSGEAGNNPMYKHQFVVYGSKSRQGAYETLFDYVHSINHEDALSSDDVLLQMLGVVDKRLGKRRLKTINACEFHPLAQHMLEVRRDAD